MFPSLWKPALFPSSLRLKAKILTMTHKALHDSAPHYLSDFFSWLILLQSCVSLLVFSNMPSTLPPQGLRTHHTLFLELSSPYIHILTLSFLWASAQMSRCQFVSDTSPGHPIYDSNSPSTIFLFLTHFIFLHNWCHYLTQFTFFAAPSAKMFASWEQSFFPVFFFFSPVSNA